MLQGPAALVQNRYLLRHDAAFRILVIEMLRDLELADSVTPWYSRVDPKPLYESPEARANWDVPVFAEHEHLPQNRVDARFIDHKEKKVIAVEMSCPWVDIRAQKDKKKTRKYGPRRWELKQQYPRDCVKQHNIIIDVLGGWSREVDLSMRELFVDRSSRAH